MKENDLVLVKLLRQVKEVLDEHNVEFWLDCGTLLGAVREGKFLTWEHDLDFGAWHGKVSQDAKVSIAKAFCDKGFKVWIAENHMNIKREDELWVWADVNFYRLDNNGNAVKPTLFPKNLFGKFLHVWLFALWAPYHPRGVSKIKSPVRRFIAKSSICISRAIPSLLRKRIAQIVFAVYEKIGSEDVSWIVPSKFFSKLDTMKFYDMEFKVPSQTQDYLALRYDKDWQIPHENWVTEKHDGAIISACERSK